MAQKKLLDDLAHLAHGAMNVADSLKADIRLLVQQTCEAWFKDIRKTLATLQQQQDTTLRRLQALEKKHAPKPPSKG